MRFSGTIFIISLMLLAILSAAWFLKSALPGEVNGVAAMKQASSRKDRMQQALSGKFKRTPKKNPDLGKGRLRGVVRDEFGAPVVGATIQVTPVNPKANILEVSKPIPYFWEKKTDGQGSFAFRTLPAGTFVVSATHKGGHGLALVTVIEQGAFAEAELALEKNVLRQGKIQDAAGQPVANARIVSLYASDWTGDAAPYRFISVESDETGTFFHPLLSAAPWEVLVIASGYAPARVTLPTEGKSVIQLEKGVILQGRVLRAENKRPLNNIRVVITAQDEAAEFYVVRTNGQGLFTVSNLRPAEYVVQADSNRYVAQSHVTVLNPDAPVDELSEAATNTDTTKQGLILMAQTAAYIRGRVFESNADYGIPGIRVEAFLKGSKIPSATAKTDQAGYYRLDGLSEGVYTVVVPGTAAQVVTTDENTSVKTVWGKPAGGPVFRAAIGEELRGSVVNARGVGVAEANVFWGRSDYPGMPRSIATDGEGNFVLSGIHETEQITIWGERMGQISEIFGPVTVGEGGLQGILLRLNPPHALIDSEGDPQQTPPRPAITSTRSS